jgi:hypothetical protein
MRSSRKKKTKGRLKYFKCHLSFLLLSLLRPASGSLWVLQVDTLAKWTRCDRFKKCLMLRKIKTNVLDMKKAFEIDIWTTLRGILFDIKCLLETSWRSWNFICHCNILHCFINWIPMWWNVTS